MLFRMDESSMKDLCEKAISEVGSKLIQLIYGVGSFVHHTICSEQKSGELLSCKTHEILMYIVLSCSA